MVLIPAKRYEPSVDPWHDTDLVDQRAIRSLQTFVATLTALAFVLDLPWLASLVGLQLIIGLLFGRKYCIPCAVYYRAIQPRFGEGRIEDSRPPRFANFVGATFLTLATVLFLLGATTAGWVLTLIVSTLAFFAVAANICVGCEMYAAFARVRGIQLATR